MTNKAPKTYWNYRVATYVQVTMYGSGRTTKDRLFCIIEAYYTKGKLDSYSTKEDFYTFEEYKDVENTHKYISEAFKKPIIDLDNFPNEYVDGKGTKRKRNNS
jgi:hypothetical protein